MLCRISVARLGWGSGPRQVFARILTGVDLLSAVKVCICVESMGG